ncbi:MAG: division/cell wall cluster transcriptional repressor MraZ [Spirochaetaceae bacterium]|jgi:MraZ protein|nr:division/cell wall cluster transcriptional repressor MraZ [Spirochaetaceae bacterium]
MLNGGYYNTLDEKGRLTFPAALQRALSGDQLVITRGIEPCLWVHQPDKWREFAGKWENASPMLKDVRKMQRHFLGWAAEAEIDKSSRLAIPQSLREYAGLKRDCVIIGVGQRIEIWDTVTYKAINEGEDGESLASAAEQFGELF